jgi:PAS domain S-box-containing protein
MKIKNAIYIFYLGLAVLIGLMVWQFKIQTDLIKSAEETAINHSQAEALYKLMVLTLNVESGVRGYMVTNNPSYLTPYNDSIDEVEKQLQVIYQIFNQDLHNFPEISELVVEVKERIQISRKTIKLKDKKQILRALDEGKDAMNKVRETVDEIMQREELQRARSIEKSKRFNETITRSSVIISLIILIFMLFAIRKVRTEIIKRSKSEDNLKINLSYLKTLTASLPTGIIALDKFGFVAFLNHRTSELLSINIEQSIGLSFEKIIHLDNESLSEISEAYGQGREFDKDIVYINGNGSELSLKIRVAPLYQNEELLGSVISIQDISKEKGIQQGLVAEKESAILASKAKTEFLSQMSHEIRTPLNAIVGMGEMLLMADLDPEAKRYAQVSSSAAQNLLYLVNDILDISKIEAGHLELDFEPFDIMETIKETIRIISFKASGKGLSVSLDSELKNSFFVGDSLRVHQIFMNLLSNAIKFTEKGSITIKLWETDGFVKVAITDTGKGIAADKLDSIFEKYEQENHSIAGQYGGTGLGLSISRELARFMGGDISADSQIGKGSTFTVLLKLPSHAGFVVQNSVKNIHLNEMKILLVDDNSDNRLVITSYLKKSPIKITEAQDGIEAIEAVDAEDFDLVLMDMHMPKLDGYQATKHLIAQGLKTPIVALTAYALKEEVEKIKEIGCVDVLAKPISRSKLLKFLKNFQNEEMNFDETEIDIDDDIKSLIPDYLSRRIEEIAKIEDLMKAKDWKGLKTIAHNLKGTALSYGQVELNDWAQQLSETIKQEDETMFDELISQYKTILKVK